MRIAVAHEPRARNRVTGTRLPRLDLARDKRLVVSSIHPIGGATAKVGLEARESGVGGQLDGLEVGGPGSQAVDVQLRVVVDDAALDAAGDGGIRVNRVGLAAELELAGAILVHIVGDIEGTERESAGAAVAVDFGFGLVRENQGACLGRLVDEQGHQDTGRGRLANGGCGQAGDERQAASEKSEKHCGRRVVFAWERCECWLRRRR